MKVYRVTFSINSVQHVVEMEVEDRKEAQNRAARFDAECEKVGLELEWFEVDARPIRVTED